MMYQTYLIAFDGNWIAVCSAPSARTAALKAMKKWPELEAGPDDFEVRRVAPGQIHSLADEQDHPVQPEDVQGDAH